MKIKLQYLCILLTLFAGIHRAAAQGTTAFTYQGQLHDSGTNANGAYTMTFKLYDASSGGNSIGTNTISPTLANGLFTVNLDFGAGAFNGGARWLDITVSNGVAQTLSPRVQVLPAPYAQFAAVAATVTNGAIMNSQLAGNAVNATNIAGGQVVKSLNGLSDSVTLSAGANVTVTPSGNTLTIASSGGSGGGGNAALATNVVSGISITNAFITNSVFAGNGWGLTNLQLSGTYTNSVTFNNTNNTFIGKFTGNGNGLTNIPAFAILGGTNSNAMTFTNSTNTFVGTFIGNGNGLTNIPAAGIVGLLYKQAVQEATTSNLPPYTYNNAAGTITGVINLLLGQLQVDGITVSPGDSVLVKNESGAYNGIYVCTVNATENAYTLTRRGDFNTATNLAAGDMVSVIQGTVNQNTTWFLTTSGAITIGTTPLTFALQLPASIFSTSAGLTLANGVVTNANLTANAVGTINIQNGAITTALIATNAVNATNIASGQVVKTLNGLTDIVTITNGANTALFTNGNSLIISAGVPNIQLFHGVTSATFTVPANVTRIMVEMWGGGGGGGSGYYAYVGSGGNQNGGQDTGYNGGGGGAGAYAWNVFTVTPGSNYSITAPGDSNGGQNGGTSSISGPGVSMTAGGGSAGSNATASGTGNGGSGGTSTGSILNMQGGGGGGSGNGGGVWRGSSGNSSDGSDGSGPGGGGNGGTGNGSANPGGGGNSGLVIVYY